MTRAAVEVVPSAGWHRATLKIGSRTIHVCGPDPLAIEEEARKYAGEVSAFLRAIAEHATRPRHAWGMYR